VWDSVAAVLRGRLTDAVIADAVRRLPPEFYRIDGERLAGALRARRDHLGEVAAKYYRLLAHEMDIYGTDKSDSARVERGADGMTTVTVSHKGAEYYRRRFDPRETREVRLYLQGGADHLGVTGDGRSSPTLRVVGGGGDDTYDVASRVGGVKLYDQRGESTARGAGINTKPWDWKPDSLHPLALPPRDWGRRTILRLDLDYGPDVQALLGYAGHTDWYGFRRAPYATRADYKILYSTGEKTFRGLLGVTRQFENSRGFVDLELFGSGIETLRWYGFGNSTTATQNQSYYRVNQDQLIAESDIGVRFGERGRFRIGPLVRWSNTDLSQSNNAVRFISVDRPYGVGHFGMVGGRASLEVDTRDYPKFATRGAAFSLSAQAYPKAWDVAEAVARFDARGSFSVAARGSWQPSLNVMAGAVKTTGMLPFFLAPTLGGTQTLRGYRPGRFAGDAAVYGSVEARVPVTRITLFVPGEQGFFAFGDAGRAYLKGENSSEIHTSAGGGIWMSFLSRANVLYVGAGKPTKDKEGTRVIAGLGFPF
jgi:hypothetical protein